MLSTLPPRASVYVHFPWCLAKCPYCDFVSYAATRDAIDHEGYADAVLRELAARADVFGGERPGGCSSAPPPTTVPRRVASVFFGGGTPSLWDPRQVGRVLRAIRATFACDEDLEVTVECNPTSLDEARARGLHAEGVNRLSIGTQSLRAEQLTFLGRLHDPRGARTALEGALASGIPRVSTDLIFGLPEQTPEDARAQAETLAGLGLQHISCYQLTIEPGTQFGELARRGRLPRADDGTVADSFLAIDAALAGRGLGHYEISNYASPGEEARHNLGYWRGEEYLGLGCGAFGFVRFGPKRPLPDDTAGREFGREEGRTQSAVGVRYRNDIDPKRYMASTRDRAKLPFVTERALGAEREAVATAEAPEKRHTVERLDGAALLRERIMLGLRLSVGFDLAAAADELGVPGWTEERAREAEKLAARGRLVRDGNRLMLPPAAWLWADDTAARLF